MSRWSVLLCHTDPLPRLVISVTGGAMDFTLSKGIALQLKSGLRKAAEATDAWIVTGGTDCGIMRCGVGVLVVQKGGLTALNTNGTRHHGLYPITGHSTCRCADRSPRFYPLTIPPSLPLYLSLSAPLV